MYITCSYPSQITKFYLITSKLDKIMQYYMRSPSENPRRVEIFNSRDSR